MDFAPGRRRPQLPGGPRQSMSAFHVTQEAQFHGAFGSFPCVRQHLGQQRSRRMPAPGRQPCKDSGLARPEALERSAEQGERLIEVCRLGDVEDRLLDCREPRPAQRIHTFVEPPGASYPSSDRIRDRERVGDQDLDEPRRRRHQAPHVRSGPVRPRGIGAAREQRGQRLSAPVVTTGQGQVHAALHAAPPSRLHPDVDGPSGHARRQALSPGDQAALFIRHGPESLERGWGRRRPWSRPSQPRVGEH